MEGSTKPASVVVPVNVEFDRETGSVISAETAVVPASVVAEALVQIFGHSGIALQT